MIITDFILVTGAYRSFWMWSGNCTPVGGCLVGTAFYLQKCSVTVSAILHYPLSPFLYVLKASFEVSPIAYFNCYGRVRPSPDILIRSSKDGKDTNCIQFYHVQMTCIALNEQLIRGMEYFTQFWTQKILYVRIKFSFIFLKSVLFRIMNIHFTV